MKAILKIIMLSAVAFLLSLTSVKIDENDLQTLTPYEETMNEFYVHSIELSTQYN